MSQVLSTYWDTGFPNAASGSCVALKHLKLVNVPCDNSLGTFYDASTGQHKPTNKTNVLVTEGPKGQNA